MWYVPAGTPVWAIPARVTVDGVKWICPCGRMESQLTANWKLFHKHMRGHWTQIVRFVKENFPVDPTESATWPKPGEGNDDGQTILFFPLDNDEFGGFLVEQKKVRTDH